MEIKNSVYIMKKIDISTFIKEGNKEVVRIMAIPVAFASEKEAISNLHFAVKNYTLNGRPFNLYYSPDNPFVAVIIHGVNE